MESRAWTNHEEETNICWLKRKATCIPGKDIPSKDVWIVIEVWCKDDLLIKEQPTCNGDTTFKLKKVSFVHSHIDKDCNIFLSDLCEPVVC